MAGGRWSPSGTPLVCAHLAINAKKLLKDARPSVDASCYFGGSAAQDRQFPRARLLDCIGQRCRRVVARPTLLFVKNDSIHVTAFDAHDRCAAGLAFQRHETKGL